MHALLRRRGRLMLAATCLTGYSLGMQAQGQPPAVPTALVSSVNGAAVTVGWTGDPSANAYVLEVGTAPGATNVFSGSIGNRTTISGTVPDGVYYWRVFATNDIGRSATSLEAQFFVGVTCTSAPSQPNAFIYAVNNSLVSLAWSGGSGGDAPTTFAIEAGSGPGRADLYNAPTGSLATQLAVSAPPGAYYVRIRARNNCGASAPSNEQVILVGQGQVACAFALTPFDLSFPAAGGSMSLLVSTLPQCSWTATSNQTWLRLSGASQGTGTGFITVTTDPNDGATRVGDVVVGAAAAHATQSGFTVQPP